MPSNIAAKTTRIRVKVTFLRMDRCPDLSAFQLPSSYHLTHIPNPDISLYRYLYDGVGRDYCWWMRRNLSDEALASLLRDPRIEVYVLKDEQGIICGFFELDRRSGIDVDLAYFGLMRHAIGRKIGFSFLCQAIRLAWRSHILCLRVNTCELDHYRALRMYLRAGFQPIRTVDELWDIPDIYQLPIPEAFQTDKIS